MSQNFKWMMAGVLFLSLFSFNAGAQTAPGKSDKTLHVIGTAHFDTQWRWTIQTSINEYIPSTFNGNFKLFEKYPDYKFSFEGAIKYMLMKEYYPEAFQRMKEYIAEGRWNICGSSVDATDVNIPSPESVIRTILLGQNYYKSEFGTKSYDIFLPDCFGFGYALPTIMTHCGLKGFSTQKLTWGAPFGVPFDIGTWQGVDGSRVFAALNGGSYGAKLRGDLSKDPKWTETVTKTGDKSGIYLGYRYFGTGDVGGAPEDSSVYYLEKAIHSDGPLKVISAPADLMARQLSPEDLSKLPLFNGELLTSPHGNGCYSSEAAMKQLNRKNELLADAAERSAVIASWLGSAYYPKATLNEAWTRFLWHQFHDDLTGTSIPEAYTFSWNDEIISQNQFAGVLQNTSGGVVRNLDTRVSGTPVVVYNPLSIEREDLIEATVEMAAKPTFIKVTDPTGTEVPSQILKSNGNSVTVLFLAKCPAVGYAVYDVAASDKASAVATGLTIAGSKMENARYKVVIDKNGDISSIYDKTARKELLKAPARLQMLNNRSEAWPAWEIMYEAVTQAPRAFFEKPVVTIEQKGSARVTLKVVRQGEGSELIQYISLAAGNAGDRIEVRNELNWNTQGTLLKAAFPLAVSNPQATYDLGIGTISRGNNQPKLYEVPAQQWADITQGDNTYGVSVLSDYKTGWDKPSDNLIRLTLIHTPQPGRGYVDQATQDIGFHTFSYAITGHKGDWRQGGTQWQAARFNQPLISFTAPKHEGQLGKTLSMVTVSTPQVSIEALKQAQNSERIVVRLQEQLGQEAKNIRIKFNTPVLEAMEVNGIEEPVGQAVVENGELVANLKGYQPKAFAVKLEKPAVNSEIKSSAWISINYDTDGVSSDKNRKDGSFDADGNSYPAELWPSEIISNDVVFKMGSAADGQKNFTSCKGQVISLPEGKYNTVYILAASSNGDKDAVFEIDGKVTKPVQVPYYSGKIGQWDNRDLKNGFKQSVRINGKAHPRPVQTIPAFIKHVPVGFVATHRHLGKEDKNEAYIFGYLFRIALDIPAGAKSVRLPNLPDLKIAAISVSDDPNKLTQPAASVTVDYVRDPQKVKETLAKINEPVTLDAVAALPALAKAPAALKPGLKYAYYEGRWRRIPDWSKLTPVSTGTMAVPELPAGHKPEYFGAVYEGYIKVPQTGDYTFFLTSDDGSTLMIDDLLITDNDGAHGEEEEPGYVKLAAGLHKVKLQYYNGAVDFEFKIAVEGPGLKKQAVPKEWWLME